MMFSSTVGSALTLLTLVAGCCAYVNISYAEDNAAPQVDTSIQGRRFGWAIDWLAARGFIGQIIANVIVAVFILPPLGPFVCALFENCDTLKIQTRALLDPSTPRSVTNDEVTEQLSRVMESLETAHEKFT